MKKYSIIIIFLITMLLCGCSSKDKRSVFGWCLRDTLVSFEQDYPDYYVLGTEYTEFMLITDEELTKFQRCEAYIIKIFYEGSDGVGGKEYLVTVYYETNALNVTLGRTTCEYSSIMDLDVCEITNINKEK